MTTVKRNTGIISLRGALELGAAFRTKGRELAAKLMDTPHLVAIFPLDDLPQRLSMAASILPCVPFGNSTLIELISALIEAHPASDVERSVSEAMKIMERLPLMGVARRALFRAALAAFARTSLSTAIALGEANLASARGQDTLLSLARLHVRAGSIRRPLELLAPEPHAPAALVRLLREQQAHLNRGMLKTSSVAAPNMAPTKERRSLYYVSQSLPHHSSGYAIRTHYLLKTLNAAGWDVEGFARFGYPNDRWDFRALPSVAPQAKVDGVSYTFRSDAGGFRTLSPEAYQRAAVDVLMEQATAFRPAIIHAASNYQVGLAGTEAARRLGLPSIYEVRGLWHLTGASKQPEYEGSEHYRMSERLEVQAARRADHVLAITAGVRDLLIAGGVEPHRVTLLPNAVDPDHFTPRDRDRGLAESFGFQDKVVIGFIGSFAPYEGLDLLLEASHRLRDELGDVFRVLLVGNGAAAATLSARAKTLGLDNLVTFTGRVPHQDVLRYYSLMDIAVYPRSGRRVCELVSPLKPLEAMAMAKAVIVSDVGGQTEMVEHERSGLVHRKDNVDSLTCELSRLVSLCQI